MLTLKNVFDAQSKYGVDMDYQGIERATYEDYLEGCKRNISDQTPVEYYSWDRETQLDYIDDLIVKYVRVNLRLIDDFVDEDGNIETDKLISQLRLDISDYGVLRDALEDEDVQEIQINDYKTIWVVKGGRTVPYVDKRGRPYQFVSNKELKSTLNRLIFSNRGDTPRLTETNPLLNTRTASKGYRVSAVNDSAITPDSRLGYDFPCTSITLRKYAPSRLTFTDFEVNGTLTPEMSRLLRLLGKADIRLACLGPTSSGKTTLLNAIVWEVDPELRLLLIQNPTEIMIYDRDDSTGANRRNALHWEAQDLPPEKAKDPTTPTMANMMAHTLRNTPDVIIPGEVRTPEEFYQMNRALKTGHRVMTTWHAMNGADGIERAATELATLGGSTADYRQSLARSFDIFVSQKKLGDGSRKVMSIEESTGRIIDGKAETKVLFEFRLTGEVDKDANGKVQKIHGYFQQVNPISEQLVQSFYAVGITKEEVEEFTKVPQHKEGYLSNLPSQMAKEDEAKSNSSVPTFNPDDF